MTDLQPGEAEPEIVQFNLHAFVMHEWPYLTVLTAVILGVAYTNFAQTPIMPYWVLLAPFIGVMCVIKRWNEMETREDKLRLMWTQGLHWAAVLLAMRLLFVATVKQQMTANASALVVLTLLALGTFTAGVHIISWRMCLIGVILAIGVPAIAWLEESAILLTVVVLAVAAIIAPMFWPAKRASKPVPVGVPHS